jgi:hypothetical protein
MTITDEVVQRIIAKLLKGEDYRIEIVSLINAEFMQYSLDFFKKVIEAKLRNHDITTDWYKKEFLDETLSTDEIAINSGLNKKTITNMYNSARREIVLEAANEHYDVLYNSIKELVTNEDTIDLTLTLKLHGVSVDLNVGETLIVINTLAVKRAALRGGLWSTAGKRVEKPLMQELCKLYGVSSEHYRIKSKTEKKLDEITREIDFYLVDQQGHEHKCEVKLMGQGNPESADAVIARSSSVFVADKLSDLNKRQLDSLKVEWVELRNQDGYKRFEVVLKKLNIPFHSTIS